MDKNRQPKHEFRASMHEIRGITRRIRPPTRENRASDHGNRGSTRGFRRSNLENRASIHEIREMTRENGAFWVNSGKKPIFWQVSPLHQVFQTLHRYQQSNQHHHSGTDIRCFAGDFTKAFEVLACVPH